MNDVIANGLEGALKAAMDANGGAGTNNGGGAPGDLVTLALKVLPKLLENREAREDLAEFDKESVFALRKEVRMLRRQLHEMVQSQKGVLEELFLMRELQSTMVSHLSRVKILEMPEDEAFEDEYDYGEDFIDHNQKGNGGSRGGKRRRSKRTRYPLPR